MTTENHCVKFILYLSFQCQTENSFLFLFSVSLNCNLADVPGIQDLVMTDIVPRFLLVSNKISSF